MVTPIGGIEYGFRLCGYLVGVMIVASVIIVFGLFVAESVNELLGWSISAI